MKQYQKIMLSFGSVVIVVYVSTNANAIKITLPDVPNSQLPSPTAMNMRSVFVDGATGSTSSVVGVSLS